MTQFAFDVFQAVDYLHKQQPPIIHRDIKPENILFCANTLKIADFGWSNLKDQVRHTFCGTPEYLAPEMLMEKGHNEKLDVWTLGILLYEMLVGVPPFTPKIVEGKNKADVEEELKANILVACAHQNVRVQFPAYLSADSVDLLKKLLVRKPGDRLSCHDALRHRFFTDKGLVVPEPGSGSNIKLFEQMKLVEHRKPQQKLLKDSGLPSPCLSALDRQLETPATVVSAEPLEHSFQLSTSVLLEDKDEVICSLSGQLASLRLAHSELQERLKALEKQLYEKDVLISHLSSTSFASVHNDLCWRASEYNSINRKQCLHPEIVQKE